MSFAGRLGKQIAVASANPPAFLEGDAAPLSVDLAGNLRIGAGAGQALARSLDLRVKVPIAADGSNAGNPITGFNRWGGFIEIMAPLAGSGVATTLRLNGRNCIVFQQPNTNCSWVLQPTIAGGAAINFHADFGLPAFVATTAAIPVGGPLPPFGYTTNLMGWARKIAAGNGSDCRMCFGFSDNTTITPSAEIARVGLIGDGVGGYLYGSVNCPDGAAAGNNLPTDRNAGAVQPADLVAPGVAWWHFWIRAVPATPTRDAHVACYHNFVKVVDFATAANLPRGSQAVNHNFDAMQCTILNLGADPPGPLTVPALAVDQLTFFCDAIYD